MKTVYKIATVLFLMLFTVQCEVIDSDLLTDPNNPSPANVDPDFLINNIQIEARNVFRGASFDGAEMTRMLYMFGSTYEDAYSSQDFDGIYGNAYSDLFIDVQNLLPITEERQLFFHAGIAKTLQAFGMLTLVDVFGDVPFSEALDPTNFNPNVDSGESIYNSALALLDEAIADFQNEANRGRPATDLYYGELGADEQQEAWIRFANTLKLKAYLNTGNASEFNALVNGGRIISEPLYDFTYQYGTIDTNPDSRHPEYADNYTDVANDYMAVNYLNMLLNDKALPDPRLRYYVYRQTTSDPTDVNLNTCIAAVKPAHFAPDDPFCLLGDGWWGRDHLINDGIPPDDNLRSTFGVYPAGGRFDNNQGEPTADTQGYQGAGIEPIMMSYMTWFMLAEGNLTLNNDPAAAKTALDQALTLSFQTVANFGAEQAAGSIFEITAEGTPPFYQGIVDERWATRDQLRVVSKEFYLALFGNGLEAYNMIRRTGYPNRVDNMQPAREPNPGNWYRTFSYPSDLIERNSNVSAKPSNLATTFWDDTSTPEEYNF